MNLFFNSTFLFFLKWQVRPHLPPLMARHCLHISWWNNGTASFSVHKSFSFVWFSCTSYICRHFAFNNTDWIIINCEAPHVIHSYSFPDSHDTHLWWPCAQVYSRPNNSSIIRTHSLRFSLEPGNDWGLTWAKVIYSFLSRFPTNTRIFDSTSPILKTKYRNMFKFTL